MLVKHFPGWYRRSVPITHSARNPSAPRHGIAEASRTVVRPVLTPVPGGWVGVKPANTHLVPPGVCGSWPLLAVWDPRFSWAHRQPTIPINLPQHIAEAADAQVLDTKMPTQTHRHALSQNTETQSHLPTQREPTNTEQAKETQTLDSAKPRKPKQQKNTNERAFPAPPGAREPQCPRHCTNTYRSSNSEQLLSMQVNHSVVFPA